MSRQAGIIQFEKTIVLPFGEGRHVVRSQYRERCFIYQSFGAIKNTLGESQIKPHVTFLADSGDGFAAEWEPQYGPIQIWTKCAEDWSGESPLGSKIESRAHWHFPFVQDGTFDYSQMAVEEEGLPGMLSGGDLDGVFDVLQRWADRP